MTRMPGFKGFIGAFAAFSFTATLMAAAQDPHVPIAEVERGSFVTLKGEVVGILDEDTFRLNDGSGQIRVYIGPNRMPVRPGDLVTINGMVDDDWGPLEIYADSLTGADGTVVTFDRRYE